MDRRLSLGILLRKREIGFCTKAALVGAVIGFFVLYPLNEFVYFYEHAPDAPTATSFVMGQVTDSLKGNTPIKTAFYAAAGTILGALTALVYGAMHRKWLRIQQLSEELGKNLEALIEQGEGPTLEFKSSFRWDLKKSSVNRALETVVIKTLAGYMNVAGGTLLIGVADNGKIVGLDNDYQSLKKKDRDGFEQALMTAVSANIGTDLCHSIQIIFHSIEKLDVCRVIVAPSGRPALITQGGNPKLYVRTGGSTRELNVQEAIEYVSRRWSK